MAIDDNQNTIPPSAKKMLRDVSDAATMAMALWKLKLLHIRSAEISAAACPSAKEEEERQPSKREQQEAAAVAEERDGPPSSAPPDEDYEKEDQDSIGMVSILEPIVALLFIDPALLKNQSTPTSSSIDRYSTDVWSENGKDSILYQRRATAQQIIVGDLTNLIILNYHLLRNSSHPIFSAVTICSSQSPTTTSREVLLGREFSSPQDDGDEVSYVKYGIVTRRISAVIEIGEDGSNKSAVVCDGDPTNGPPDTVDKQDEIIITKRIPSDTSDMTMESVPQACAESITPFTNNLASTEAGEHEEVPTQEAENRKGAEEDDVASVTYSMASIERMKAEVANALIKMSCSSESYANSINRPTQQKGRVQFAETIVSEVRERPRIEPDVVRDLFYSISDIERFEDDAEESSYDSSSVSTSFSYTVTFTPTSSYLEGEDSVENETPVESEPTKGHKIIGTDTADCMVAEAYNTLIAHLTNMNASTDDSKRVVLGPDKIMWPNNGTAQIPGV